MLRIPRPTRTQRSAGVSKAGLVRWWRCVSLFKRGEVFAGARRIFFSTRLQKGTQYTRYETPQAYVRYHGAGDPFKKYKSTLDILSLPF